MSAKKINRNEEFVKEYRKLGLNVFPCKPKSKEPKIPWKEYQDKKYEGTFGPDDNLAVTCGKASESLVVIDFDFPEIIPEFEKLKEKTLVTKTGGGGFHIFGKIEGKLPSIMRLDNQKGQHIDIQSHGSYVVVPPSIHPNGQNYSIVSNVHEIAKIDIEGILKQLKKYGFDSNSSKKSIDEIKQGVSEGDRNDAMFRLAMYLRKEGLEKTTLEYELNKVNEKNKPPLTKSELNVIIESASKYEVEKKHLNTTQNKIKTEAIFVTEKPSSTETKYILEEDFNTIKPQTLLFDEKNTAMILVYLPTRKENAKGQGKKQIIDCVFENSAYFVINKSNEKIILNYDNEKLKENFRIDVLPTWYNTRWQTKDISLWQEEEEKIEPKKLYDLIDRATKRYIDFQEKYTYDYLNLWNIGTYFYELFDAYPGNDLTGTKRSGKSKVLEFQKNVCYNTMLSPDISGSAFFRTIEGTGATILLDETENFRDKRNENAQNIRRLVLQGMMKDQYVVRSETKEQSFTPKTYAIYSPKSMAHISGLDDVMQDRFIKLIMKRTKTKEILNTQPTKKDPAFQQIRNYCYRLFLDHAYEIYDLIEEAKSKSPVSGRELQLWTPIFTLALFFEKHGVSGLIESIYEFAGISSKNRQTEDEEGNKDLKILQFIDKVGVSLAQDTSIDPKNPQYWAYSGTLYQHLIDSDNQEEYDIIPEYFTKRVFNETMQRLGFKYKRKPRGFSFLVTREIVDEIKETMGMDLNQDNAVSKDSNFSQTA